MKFISKVFFDRSFYGPTGAGDYLSFGLAVYDG